MTHTRKRRFMLDHPPLAQRTLDHEPPKARVSPYGHPYRYLMACRDCNALKGERTESEFRAWLATPDGERWKRMRVDEIATGALSSVRLTFEKAPKRQALLLPRRTERRARRHRFREMVRHGWTLEEIRKRWGDPLPKAA